MLDQIIVDGPKPLLKALHKQWKSNGLPDLPGEGYPDQSTGNDGHLVYINWPDKQGISGWSGTLSSLVTHTLPEDWNELAGLSPEDFEEEEEVEFQAGQYWECDLPTTDGPIVARVAYLKEGDPRFVRVYDDPRSGPQLYAEGWIGEPAPNGVVKRALLKEARRRYDVPCPIEYMDGRIERLRGYKLTYDPDWDTLYASTNEDIVYLGGRWADTVTEKEVAYDRIRRKLDDLRNLDEPIKNGHIADDIERELEKIAE